MCVAKAPYRSKYAIQVWSYLRLSYEFLDERDVHQGRVGVDELEHEGLRNQIILIFGVRAVVFLTHV